MRRFILSLFTLGLAAVASANDSAVVFSEIQYHPADETTQTEWIELHNLLGVNVDISGWRLEGGIDFTFPETTMAGGAYLVVAKLPGQIAGAVTGNFTGSLSNSGEEIRLINRSGRVMDVLDYKDDGDWPVAPDGTGVTLARRSSVSADEGPLAWTSSNQIGGTPGAANFLDVTGGGTSTIPIPIDAVWKYNVSNVAPAATWKTAAFNDSAWASGAGLLYGGTGKLAEPQPPGEALSEPGVGILGWWAFDETSGTVAANSVAGGTPGTLVGSEAVFVNDATRGRVIRMNLDASGTFNTASSYVTAGTLPTMTLTNNFTWAFWAKSTDAAATDVVVGNRYAPGGGEYSPLEFIKFTALSFEWYRGGAIENVDYADFGGTPAAPGPWIHHCTVKQGNTLRYYRNGILTNTLTITQAPVNQQPFFFGADGTAGAREAWSGFMDDVAIWNRALPSTAVAGLANGTYTPGNVPTASTPTGGVSAPPSALVFPTTTGVALADDFAAAAIDSTKWTIVDRGLESIASTSYNPPASVNGQLVLGGSTGFSYWAGKSLQTVKQFSTRDGLTVSVDRVSLSGSGSAYRSSMWIFADDTHYVHYSQNVGENGWQYNLNDAGGAGSASATAGGVTLTSLAGSTSLGLCTMKMVFTPGANVGSGTIEFYLNDVLAGQTTFSNWPSQYRILLTGQGRQSGDTVSAVFDNFQVTSSVAQPLQTNVGAVPQTAYFRKTFNFGGDPSSATLNMWPVFDDGAIFYLNGQEVYRQNMPGDPITHATAASAPVGDATFPAAILPIPVGALLNGTNILAVEVHQASPTGGDLLFGAQLHATELPLPPPDTSPKLVFNEIFRASATDFKVELANLSGSAINLANYQIRSTEGASYTLTGTLNAGALLVLNQTQLGFVPTVDQRLSLVNGAQTVSDARTVTAALRGRTADGSWGHPNVATFGTANSFIAHDEIVINEIMYNLPDSSPEQWIELYNKSAGAVDLSDWHFTDGIDYTFPAGTTLGAGQYALVVWNVSAFNTIHPGLPRVFGPFTGSLSGKGERLRLRDASDNLADEVNYSTSGRWPEFADGGGSSLELRNPSADNSVAEAWAASDEVSHSTWKNVSYDFPGTNLSGNPNYYSELDFGLVTSGEVLIDDLSVKELSPDIELLASGSFASLASYRAVGNHNTSTIVPDPSSPGNSVLKIVAKGYTEHMSNHIETTLRNGATLPYFINEGKTYRISYRARWAGGSNRLHTRLYFNRGAHQEILPRPTTGGTPGAVNSRFVANAGPTFQNLIHSPAVPAVNQAAKVTVKVTDPDNLNSVTLFYSVNEAAFQSLPMTLQSGLYTATIPGQQGNSKVQFYVQATDGLNATTTFPAAGANSRALIPWDDGLAQLTLGSGAKPHNFRIVMTTTDTNRLHALNNVMSNEFIPCTVIYDERDIYYFAGVHLKGSEHGRAKDVRVGFHLDFSPDQLFLGKHDEITIDRSGAGDEYSQKEILIKRTLNHAGNFNTTEDDLIRVIAPRSQHTGPAILTRTKLDSDNYLDGQFPDGSNGTVFEYELTYPLFSGNIASSTDTGGWEGLKLTQDSPGPGGVGLGKLSPGTSKEEYRWFYLIKNNRSKDNYDPMIASITALGQSSASINTLLDVDGWLRAFSGPVAWGVGDNYAYGSQHNALFYTKSDGRLLYIPYDMDFTASQGATADIHNPNGDLSKLANLSPANRRAYYGHLLDLCNTSFNATYLTPWAAHYTKFVNQDLTSFMSFVSQRESYIRGQISSAVPSTTFAITTNGGANFSVAANSTVLSGTGWVDVREIRRADTGLTLPVTWTSTTAFQVTVALNAGANPITLQAINHQGAVIATASITITNTLTPTSPRDFLRISEVQYHPAAPTTPAELAISTDGDDFEFIELVNLASSQLDITNCRFTSGVIFTFPATTTLAAGERVVIVRNVAAFRARYGNGPRVIGAYDAGDGLNNSDDTLVLVDATGALIESFTYTDSAPWPVRADTLGYSLVRRNLTASAANPQNWRGSTAVGGNPGGSDSTTFTGNPTADSNGDGTSDLLQYALAGNTPLVLPAGSIEGGYFTFRFRRNTAADDVALIVERSLSVAPWTTVPDTAVYVSETFNADGTTTETWRSTVPAGGTNKFEFFRLRAVK